MIDVSPLPGVEQAVFEPRDAVVSQSRVIEPGDVASFELREEIVAPSPGRLEF